MSRLRPFAILCCRNDALEDEAVAQCGAPRGRVVRIAFPFVAPVTQRFERISREQILRLGAERCALQRRRIDDVPDLDDAHVGRMSISVAMPTRAIRWIDNGVGVRIVQGSAPVEPGQIPKHYANGPYCDM